MARRRSTHVPSRNRPPPSATNRPLPAGVQNLLLAALPKVDRERLVPNLEVIPLKLKAFLHKPGEPIRHVYFPGGGFCSIVTVLEDGSMVEVATIGREGMLGVSAVLDGHPSVICRDGAGRERHLLPDDGARVSERNGSARVFYELLTHYTQALVGLHHASQPRAMPCTPSSNGWRAGS